MPIYDYACARCDEVTEVIHGIHDPGPRFCPACGAQGALRKVITTSAVHFKGSGWAKKDRASSASSRGARAAKPSGDGGTAGGETAGGEAAAGEPGPAGSETTTKRGAGSESASGPAASAGAAARDGGD